MTPEERSAFIAQYAAGYDEVTKALTDFPAGSLGAHPIPGKWSAREIVHHLGDSESTSAWRLRRLLVEDKPLIQGYDQDEFATKLHYNDRDMAPALEAFRSARATTTQLLGMMSEDGKGAPINIPQAIVFYELAAQRGAYLPCVHLARIHAQGNGVPQSSKLATQWYERVLSFEGKVDDEGEMQEARAFLATVSK